MLQRVAVCCSVLQWVAVCCVLCLDACVTVRYLMIEHKGWIPAPLRLHRVAVSCSELQCSVLQCVAVCDMGQSHIYVDLTKCTGYVSTEHKGSIPVHLRLQCVAVCCSVSQHVTAYCSVLQCVTVRAVCQPLIRGKCSLTDE